MFKDKRIGLISLGCDKNRVDSERALALIDKRAILTNEVEKANVIVINSCAFLESARKEAIDTVFEINELRKTGNLEKIVLTGCLPAKFISELFDELLEVDVFMGFLDYDLLFDALELAYKGERVNFVNKNKKVEIKERVLTTPCHYSYLKIADGCNNKCTYCLIPKIRGAYVSEPIELLVEEAKALGELEELILVAQDVTRYGEDLYQKRELITLIRELSKLENIKSIRLLYCYPDAISNELILEIKNNPKILKYVDIPLQHSENGVLKRMNRRGSREDYLALINKLKAEIPNIAIRSTFITGFPGETKKDFKGLIDFIKRAKLFNCGFFAYSREEGTPAFKLDNQIEQKVKQKRVKKLYSVQRAISKRKMKEFIGKEIEVVCDGIDYDKQYFYGRPYFFAPDIDGRVYLINDGDICEGEKYKVKITNATDYDLYGRIIDEFTK